MHSAEPLAVLSHALLGNDESSSPEEGSELGFDETSLDNHWFTKLWTLANSHHVIMRAFPAIRSGLMAEDGDLAEWIDRALSKEEARAKHALVFLQRICLELEDAGDVMVIKSLDHWPDLGSDLDLYTNARPADVISIMRRRFQAVVAERSWGDKLAGKWNFIVPGLPELVEVHVGRLGQTGEQIALTQSLLSRAQTRQFEACTFKVAAPEERIIISTLQRMYRHLYVRLCDIVDNAKLVDSGAVDYRYLEVLARAAGLWEGLATYLVIVSQYVESYRGQGFNLPTSVTDAARFGNELVRFQRNFLRIPIFPEGARLYASEWKRLLLKGEIFNTLRLSLLPGLATAAALEFKLTGNDKGIW